MITNLSNNSLSNNSFFYSNKQDKNNDNKQENTNATNVKGTILDRKDNPYIKTMEDEKKRLEEELKKIENSDLTAEEKADKSKAIQEGIDKIDEELTKLSTSKAIEDVGKNKQLIEEPLKNRNSNNNETSTEEEVQESTTNYLASTFSDLEIQGVLKRLGAMYTKPEDATIKARIDSAINDNISKLNKKIASYEKYKSSEKSVDKNSELDKEEDDDKITVLDKRKDPLTNEELDKNDVQHSEAILDIKA